MTKRKYQRLAPSVWAKICGEWEIGDATLGELSHRFGVNTLAASHSLPR
jgi:hypothetical protein